MLAGGLLLAWPAVLNGYPILFSDTGAFLSQTLEWFWAFDKPVAYGLWLHAFHWGRSLWPAALAQAALTSWVLWLVGRVFFGGGGAGRHLLLCGVLAGLTAAPWVAVLLMPDVFASMAVLALALLGFGWGRLKRWERIGLPAVATLAVSVHPTHVLIAGSLVLLVLVVRRRALPVLRTGLPVLAAVALVVGCNWVGFGRLAVSPFGSVFLLARLVADGPAAGVIRARCPGAGWSVCGWADRLPVDSDEFLWSPDGPLWALPDGERRPGGAIGFAPEAAAVVVAALWEAPWAVARTGLANAGRQLVMAGVGDTLGNRDLPGSVGLKLARLFPTVEQARYAASLQAEGRLAALAVPLVGPQGLLLLLGGALTLAVGWRAWRAGDRPELGLVLAVLTGVLANAAACGALSGPHERYQARIAWLLPVVGALGMAEGAVLGVRRGLRLSGPPPHPSPAARGREPIPLDNS